MMKKEIDPVSLIYLRIDHWMCDAEGTPISSNGMQLSHSEDVKKTLSAHTFYPIGIFGNYSDDGFTFNDDYIFDLCIHTKLNEEKIINDLQQNIVVIFDDEGLFADGKAHSGSYHSTIFKNYEIAGYYFHRLTLRYLHLTNLVGDYDRENNRIFKSFNVTVSESKILRIEYFRTVNQSKVIIRDCEIDILVEESHEPSGGELSLSENKIEYLVLSAHDIILDKITSLKLLNHINPSKATFTIRESTFEFDENVVHKYFHERSPAFEGILVVRKNKDFFGKTILVKSRLYYHFASAKEFNSYALRSRKDLCLRNKQTQLNIINTMKKLNKHEDLRFANTDIDRYLQYFSSRDSFLKRLLYFVHGGYYRILKPVIFIGLFQMIVHQLFGHLTVQIDRNFFFYSINLFKFLDEVIFPAKVETKTVMGDSIILSSILVLNCLCYFLAFCIFKAFKTIYGFEKNEQK